MNALDIGILVVLAAFAIYGAVKGLVRIVLGFAALALGILLAAWLSGPFSIHLSRWIASETARRLAAAAILFLGAVIACALLAWGIRKALAPAHLLWADRLAGAAAGILLAALLVSAAMVPLAALLPAGSPALGESVLTPWVLRVAGFTKSVVPEEIRLRFEVARERLLRAGEGILPGGSQAPDDPNAAPPARSTQDAHGG